MQKKIEERGDNNNYEDAGETYIIQERCVETRGASEKGKREREAGK
jgi:hypothetical protein